MSQMQKKLFVTNQCQDDDTMGPYLDKEGDCLPTHIDSSWSFCCFCHSSCLLKNACLYWDINGFCGKCLLSTGPWINPLSITLASDSQALVLKWWAARISFDFVTCPMWHMLRAPFLVHIRYILARSSSCGRISKLSGYIEKGTHSLHGALSWPKYLPKLHFKYYLLCRCLIKPTNLEGYMFSDHSTALEPLEKRWYCHHLDLSPLKGFQAQTWRLYRNKFVKISVPGVWTFCCHRIIGQAECHLIGKDASSSFFLCDVISTGPERGTLFWFSSQVRRLYRISSWGRTEQILFCSLKLCWNLKHLSILKFAVWMSSTWCLAQDKDIEVLPWHSCTYCSSSTLPIFRNKGLSLEWLGSHYGPNLHSG